MLCTKFIVKHENFMKYTFLYVIKRHLKFGNDLFRLLNLIEEPWNGENLHRFITLEKNDDVETVLASRWVQRGPLNLITD